MKMVNVNLITSGAQKILTPVTMSYQGTNYNYSASVRTQHSGRTKTAIDTIVMEMYGVMERGAGGGSSTVTIRHTCIIIIEQGVILVIYLSVKTRVIRYLRDSHTATLALTLIHTVTSVTVVGQTIGGNIRVMETVNLNVITEISGYQNKQILIRNGIQDKTKNIP